MIFDGLVGPQLAPKNLATVGTWLHYRGLVVLALLFAGNLFCMACPFMLTRRGGRWVREHWLRGGRPAPGWLRSKWVAVGLVVLFFFAYEIFALWATPWWTAWVALAYFAVAFAVDTVFQGAAFCKHVCPLGQFNFFGSLISPLEIKVRAAHVCEGCKTKDCITARPTAVGLRGWEGETRELVLSPHPPIPASFARGCELNLFQQRKVGNMDCTFCLDCIHACPYDNVGILGRTPSKELWADPWRSGIGRFSQRCGPGRARHRLHLRRFLNAFNMIKPVYGVQAALAAGVPHRLARAGAAAHLRVWPGRAARRPAQRGRAAHAHASCAGCHARRSRPAATSGRLRPWASACGWPTTRFTS